MLGIEKLFSNLEERRIRSTARHIARVKGLKTVTWVNPDLSITSGNVTFDKSILAGSTAEGLAILAVYFSDEGYASEGLEPVHKRLSEYPAEEPGWEGWTEGTNTIIEPPVRPR